MNPPLSAEQLTTLCELIYLLYDGRITPDDRARLEDWVCHHQEARRVYVQYMHLFASICWHKSQSPPPAAPAPAAPEHEGRATLFGFLADAFRAGGDFLARPFVVSLAFAVVLPSLILTVLFVSLYRQPAPSLTTQPTVAIQAAESPAVPPPVAWVTKAHECEWRDGGNALVAGSRLLPGRRLRLAKGLLEITFAHGARVLLEGPVDFNPKSADIAVLSFGSLVAHVSGEAKGFAVETPAATIVDLGTEFGVAVDGEAWAATVHVFDGEVELNVPAFDGGPPVQHHVTAGHTGRVARPDGQHGATFTETTSAVDRFVREIPGTGERSDAITADFSGGNGDATPDQFPGVAGAGWAGAWTWPETKEGRLRGTVEQADPILGGGDYLRVEAERTSGRSLIRQQIERSIEVNGAVDLRKPYVVSFSLRIDSLGRFLGDTQNSFAVCSTSTADLDKDIPRSGWRIHFSDKRFDQVVARNWYFASGTEGGGSARIDSGIPVREGDTYSFRILFDPVAKQWSPSIAVNGGKWTRFDAVGVRSPGSAEELQYWSQLRLYWVLGNGNQGADVEKIGFSIDSVRISPAY
ncbi:MAG: FecR domain-containing protein [Pirellulaceae bacterium]|nr:FecR domain-containing protein [Pirellulaceae bacterium]